VTDGLRVTMYVDGFNLYYGLLKPNPALRWLDLAARGGAKACPVTTTGGSRSSRSPSSSRSIAGPDLPLLVLPTYQRAERVEKKAAEQAELFGE